MNQTVIIWYPNYRNNPGIVSKELRSQIESLTEHFEVEVGEGYFDGYEKYLLNLEFKDMEYRDYVLDRIHQELGKFTRVDQIQPGDRLLGRIISPGKVGFGVFVDVGIRSQSKQNDALLPLYQLREDLELDELSTREIVRMLGWVDGYPIPVVVDDLQVEPKLKINLRLHSSYIQQLIDWADKDLERMIFTKTLTSSVTTQLRNLRLMSSIDDVTSRDPLTTILTCNNRTHASGLVPKLGARLNKVPIGIFHP